MRTESTLRLGPQTIYIAPPYKGKARKQESPRRVFWLKTGGLEFERTPAARGEIHGKQEGEEAQEKARRAGSRSFVTRPSSLCAVFSVGSIIISVDASRTTTDVLGGGTAWKACPPPACIPATSPLRRIRRGEEEEERGVQSGGQEPLVGEDRLPGRDRVRERDGDGRVLPPG